MIISTMFQHTYTHIHPFLNICLYFIYLIRSSTDWYQNKRDSPASASKCWFPVKVLCSALVSSHFNVTSIQYLSCIVLLVLSYYIIKINIYSIRFFLTSLMGWWANQSLPLYYVRRNRLWSTCGSFKISLPIKQSDILVDLLTFLKLPFHSVFLTVNRVF